MRRLFLMLFVVISMSVFGQNYTKSDLVFYGVNYSLAKVYGASESFMLFRYAFDDINTLFITEPKKYNVEKILKQNVIKKSFDAVRELHSKIDPQELYTESDSYKLTQEEIAQAIQTMPLEEEEGTGFVLIARLLNKPEKWGTYTAVYFNIATREVYESFDTGGKAGGFGLRNYWAHSMLQALKKF
ncbi:hypothetical protein [Bacteroides sp. 519]|uniref:hypothetical protein n=1 Tax=Bacteroides sp. 519 TaxID=2302937 RepID=UPI0013D20DF7|nr:hypothetical protein [Bacteroides sp. 519]NDV60698.1 hypothetical protein [Bacteroides sp. 519]